MADPTSVIVADDHPMIASGVAETIGRQPGLRLDGCAANGRDAVALFADVRPDIALFDIHMPDLDGVEATRRVHAFDPSARVILFTSFEEELDVRRGLEAGVAGFLSKAAPESELVHCLSTVARGGKYFSASVGRIVANWLSPGALSDRELQILQLVASGDCNKRVARSAGITEGTTKSHLKNIFRKLGASSRTEAVNTAMKRGIIRIA